MNAQRAEAVVSLRPQHGYPLHALAQVGQHDGVPALQALLRREQAPPRPEAAGRHGVQDGAQVPAVVDVRAALFHPSCGFGSIMRDDALNCRFTTLPREVVKLETQKSMLSEEMRILYVAMTRAKEKLYAVMTLKNRQNALHRAAAMAQASVDAPSEKFLRKFLGSFPKYLRMKPCRHKVRRSFCSRRRFFTRRAANCVRRRALTPQWMP